MKRMKKECVFKQYHYYLNALKTYIASEFYFTLNDKN